MSISSNVGQRNVVNDEYDYDYWMYIMLEKLPIVLVCWSYFSSYTKLWYKKAKGSYTSVCSPKSEWKSG